ncbi:MAG: outer membrane protein assembly factor BamB family protein, partial [bacterium]
LFMLLFISTALSAYSENWPQWWGPFLNGSTKESNLPVSFSENIIWAAKMPGPGPSTPVIWEDKVFITAGEMDTRKLWTICLDRKNGKELWKHEIGIGFDSRNGNNGAASSPITDGESVYFFFGTGELRAYDMNGRELWRRNIQNDHGIFQNKFYYGASPLLYNGKIYLSVIHEYTNTSDEPNKPKPMSYLLCIDAKTGKDLWKYERKTDAISESMDAYTTPYPFEGINGLLIITAGANYVIAHDPKDGKEVWRWGNLNPRGNRNFRLVPTVVSSDNLVIFCQPRGGVLFALDGNKTGQLSEKDLAWVFRGNVPDVCSPLVMDGKLFILDGDRRIMTCLNPKTGNVIWSEKLGVNDVFQASPTGADGKIYCISIRGQIVVLSAKDTFEILSQTNLDENECRSTIAIFQGQIFIKTSENLYCISASK